MGLFSRKKDLDSEDNGKRRVKKREYETVFRSDFIIDSVKIEKKEILNYIAGKVYAAFGDDYYYAYVYKNGILSFVAQSSGTHDVGALSVFTPAFLADGRYVYVDYERNTFYFIVSVGGEIQTEIGYEERDGYDDITAFAIPDDVPNTLFFQWSQQKRKSYLWVVTLVSFVLSVAFLAFSITSYNQLSQIASGKLAQINAAKAKEQPVTQQKLPDVVMAIKKVGDMVEGQGIIKKIDYQPTTKKLEFKIIFEKDFYAQAFLKKYGGKNEGSEIIYSADLAVSR